MAPAPRFAVLTVIAALLLAGSAAAGPPGSWTQVTGTNGPDRNTLEVGVARTSNGLLNVLWTRDKTVFNTQLSSNAKTLAGPHTVFVYDDQSGAVTTSSMLLPAPGGGLRAFFAGLYPKHPLDVGMATATSTDGVGWAVQPTLASNSHPGQRSSVYAAAGIGGTFMNDGTPVSIWGDSAPGQAGYHVGLDDKGDDVHFGGSAATVGGPNAATDSASGAIAIGWNDLDSGRTLFQIISPAGPRLNAPDGQAPDALERVSMTGRDGAGIHAAYLLGTNPFLGRMGVWRVGSPSVFALSNRGARFPGVARGPGGRIWAFWAQRTRNVWRLYARRSNASVTLFGARVSVKAPPGADSVFSTEGEGTAPGGMLDLLVLAGSGDALGTWHQRIRPGITMVAKSFAGGKVRFTTRDAGKPLNTKIKFAGKTATTGGDGKVLMTATPGRRTARATRTGYQPASLRVTVLK